MFMRYFPGGGVGHTVNQGFFQSTPDDAENEPRGEESGDEEDELESDSEMHQTTMPPSQAQAEQPFAIDSEESVDGESSCESDGSFDSDPEGDDDLNKTDLDDWQWDDGYGSA